MGEPAVRIDEREEGMILRLGGAMVTSALGTVERVLGEIPRKASREGPVVIDLSEIEALDTGGAWAIAGLVERLEAEGLEVSIRGGSEAQRTLIATVAESRPRGETVPAPSGGPAAWLETLGRRMAEGVRGFLRILALLGLVMTRLAQTLLRPGRLRLTSLVHHMQEVGLNAVPIVVLLSFLIGVVLAFQGAVQLRQFGAEVFVVNLIAVSVLRELGILLTAIIVAGRSGSAFTASIGSMKLREEIDAMRIIGLDPIEVLVLPRVLALIIMLPVLGLIADVSGLVGGALMSWAELGVSPRMFLVRLYETTDIWHLAIGFIKAPFFAAIIGIVGCYQGLQVEGSAEAVGQRTTSSVVQAIFGVIVADAVFSVFFAEIGV